jgi:hypothetical protein
MVAVYLTYPETCGVRLEDMNELFGDARTGDGTPFSRAEADSLILPGSPSEVGGHQVRHRFGSSNAASGLIDTQGIDENNDGKNGPSPATNSDERKGVKGWLAWAFGRARGNNFTNSDSGRYAPLQQGDE